MLQGRFPVNGQGVPSSGFDDGPVEGVAVDGEKEGVVEGRPEDGSSEGAIERVETKVGRGEGIAVEGRFDDSIEIEVGSCDGFGEALGDDDNADGDMLGDTEGFPDGESLNENFVADGRIEAEGKRDGALLEGAEVGVGDSWSDGKPDGSLLDICFEGDILKDIAGVADGSSLSRSIIESEGRVDGAFVAGLDEGVFDGWSEGISDGKPLDRWEGILDGRSLEFNDGFADGVVDVEGEVDGAFKDGLKEGADDCWKEGIPDGPFINSLEGPFEGATLEDPEGFADGV